MKFRCAVAALVAVAGFALPSVAASPAHATTLPSIWMIKGQDLQPWANPYPSATCPAGATCYVSNGLVKQAAQDGVTLPPVAYRLCGTWNGVTYGYSDYTPCAAGDTLVVENYFKLQQAINDGLFTSLGITRAVYDIESWSYSPGYQQDHPVRWIGRTIALGRSNGLAVGIITSPGGALMTCSSCWAAAAEDGGFMVAIQSQGWGWDKQTQSWCLACWDSQVRNAIAAVRKARAAAGTPTVVMVGLGTDTPLVHPAWVLAREYDYARSIGVLRFWFNANNWGSRNQCTASQGSYGCPQIGVLFFKAIGVAT